MSAEWLQKFLPVIILFAAIYVFLHRSETVTTQQVDSPQNNYKSGVLGSIL